jgi:hypothetical protein
MIRVDLPPIVNQQMLFDAIGAFERMFGGNTVYMRAFLAYYAVHPAHTSSTMAKHAAQFLPQGISVEEARKLGRLAAFDKFTEMFARESVV